MEPVQRKRFGPPVVVGNAAHTTGRLYTLSGCARATKRLVRRPEPNEPERSRRRRAASDPPSSALLPCKIQPRWTSKHGWLTPQRFRIVSTLTST